MTAPVDTSSASLPTTQPAPYIPSQATLQAALDQIQAYADQVVYANFTLPASLPNFYDFKRAMVTIRGAVTPDQSLCDLIELVREGFDPSTQRIYKEESRYVISPKTPLSPPVDIPPEVLERIIGIDRGFTVRTHCIIQEKVSLDIYRWRISCAYTSCCSG